MFFQKQSLLITPALIAVLATILPGAIASTLEANSEFDVPPWQQIEVIIFSQKSNYGSEAAPRDYQLTFPENWIELIDSEQAELEAEENLETTLPTQFPNEFSDSSQVNTVEASDNNENLIQLEEPFQLLDKTDRNLNESARAIDRRSQYNVLFHEAWRQAAIEDASSPWVIIKAGKTFDDRFQLEGSLRLYKSRFLHFETNLWLLAFDSESEHYIERSTQKTNLFFQPNEELSATESEKGLIELPAFPERPLLEETEIEQPDEILLFESSIEKGSSSDSSSTTQESTSTDTALFPDESDISTPLYPVRSVWTFKTSKRLDEERVHYLDHPEMGILVIVKPHQPEVLSPIEEENSNNIVTE